MDLKPMIKAHIPKAANGKNGNVTAIAITPAAKATSPRPTKGNAAAFSKVIAFKSIVDPSATEVIIIPTPVNTELITVPIASIAGAAKFKANANGIIAAPNNANANGATRPTGPKGVEIAIAWANAPKPVPKPVKPTPAILPNKAIPAKPIAPAVIAVNPRAAGIRYKAPWHYFRFSKCF